VTAPKNLNRHRDPWWLLIDPLLMLTSVAIGALGVVLVYSATRGSATSLIPADRSFMERQSVFLVAGVGAGVVAALLDVRRLRKSVPLLYGGFVLALMAVLVVGVEVNGARAWFQLAGFQLQPSEPGKLVVILALASLFAPSKGEVGTRRLVVGLVVAGLPIGLILIQPDMGTVLVYIAILVAIVVVSGVRARLIALLALLAVTGTIAVFQSNVLAQYQEARLTVFLFDTDEVDADAEIYAYNAEQAQIAIGNGGLTGEGLFEGTQTRSQLVPEQQTDFIFTVAGEELGFRGAGLLLGLYAILLYRIWRTAQNASSVFGRLLCTGVFAMFLFQVFQAVGMTMGMMPVTGIPLPLVSYGGSSMLTSMVALGLVAGVHRRRYEIDHRG
jgi:rod shape determining protein RodA